MNENNNKLTTFKNKSIDSRNRLNTQRNNDISSNFFKTLYNKKIEKKIVKCNHNNLNQLFFKNKINYKSIERRKNKDKRIK